MEKEFVPYEIALQLKELGFDEPCLKVGNPNGHIMWKWIEVDGYPPTVSINDIIQVHYSKVWIQIPTFSQAFRWFREKYGLFIQPNRTVGSEGIWYYFSISSKRTDVCEGSFIYEEAELACLIKLIEIVKTK